MTPGDTAVADVSKDGAFVPSCLDHTNMNHEIDGIQYLAALGDWYFERTDSDMKIYDSCVSDDGLPCGKC